MNIGYSRKVNEAVGDLVEGAYRAKVGLVTGFGEGPRLAMISILLAEKLDAEKLHGFCGHLKGGRTELDVVVGAGLLVATP